MLENIITVDRLLQQIWVKQRSMHIVRWQKVMSLAKLDLGSSHFPSCSRPRSCDWGTCCLAGPSREPQWLRIKKPVPERAWELWVISLLDVESFQNIEMMKMDKQPKNDRTSPGMLPTLKMNSWAVLPGALFLALASYREWIWGKLETYLSESIFHTVRLAVFTK